MIIFRCDDEQAFADLLGITRVRAMVLDGIQCSEEKVNLEQGQAVLG